MSNNLCSPCAGEDGVVWKGTWDQEMKGVPETHYFTWKIPSGFFLALSECPLFQVKTHGMGPGMTTLEIMNSRRKKVPKRGSLWSPINQAPVSVASNNNKKQLEEDLINIFDN